MKIINISEVTNSDTFDTLAKADIVLDNITKETTTISLDGLTDAMSSPLHHMIISLCIRKGFGLESLDKICWSGSISVPNVIFDKLSDALERAQEIYGQTKPSDETSV